MRLLLDMVNKEVDVNARISVIRAIANQGLIDKNVNTVLTWNSRDSNPQVRRASLEALNILNSPVLADILLERLEDPDQGVRLFSIDIMGNKKLGKCVDALISLLRLSSDPPTVVHVAEALRKIQEPRVIEPLFEKFKTGPPDTRPNILQALQSYGEKPKDSFLRTLSESDDIQLLQLSIGALQNIGGEEVMEPIAKKLNHSDQSVRNAAKDAMINLKGSTKYVIKEFMDNPQNPTIHETLQNKGRPAVECLLGLKDHENDVVRTNATNVLNALVQNYQNLLSSGSPQHKVEATEVYLKLSEASYPIPNIDVVRTQIVANLSFDDVKVQVASLRALRKFGDAAAIDAVETLLRASSDKNVVIESLRALGEFQDSKPIESVKDKAKSDDVEIRKEAVVALGKIGENNPKLVEDYLSDFLYDPNPDVKLEAIGIADRLKIKKAIKALKELELYGPTDQIKEKAGFTLGNLQTHFIDVLSSSSLKESLLDAIDGLTTIERSSDKVIEVLFNLEKRFPDKDVRKQAVDALGVFGNEKILDKMEEIDISEPGIREAKNRAVERIQKVVRESETAIDRLRRGEVSDKESEILRTINKHDHSAFGEYAEDIANQLDKQQNTLTMKIGGSV